MCSSVHAKPHLSPLTPTLVFLSLFYRYKGRTLIKGVSGHVKQGSCVALIGAPDSGVTTLLRCLAGRTAGGTVQGQVLVNGAQPEENMRRIVAFVSLLHPSAASPTTLRT